MRSENMHRNFCLHHHPELSLNNNSTESSLHESLNKRGIHFHLFQKDTEWVSKSLMRRNDWYHGHISKFYCPLDHQFVPSKTIGNQHANTVNLKMTNIAQHACARNLKLSWMFNDVDSSQHALKIIRLNEVKQISISRRKSLIYVNLFFYLLTLFCFWVQPKVNATRTGKWLGWNV